MLQLSHSTPTFDHQTAYPLSQQGKRRGSSSHVSYFPTDHSSASRALVGLLLQQQWEGLALNEVAGTELLRQKIIQVLGMRVAAKHKADGLLYKAKRHWSGCELELRGRQKCKYLACGLLPNMKQMDS